MKKLLKIIVAIAAIVTIGWNAELTTSEAYYGSGESVWIQLHDRPDLKKDWIGIYRKGDSSEWKNVVKWVWEKDTSFTEVYSGDWYKFTGLKDGKYEARFFLQNSFNVDYKTSFSIGEESNPISNMSLTQKKYTPDSTISVNLSDNLSGKQDWVGIYPIGSSNGWSNIIAWNWVHSGDNTLSKKLKDMTVGEYEARLFFNNSYKVENSVEFSVNNNDAEASNQCTIGNNLLKVIVETNNQKGVSLFLKKNNNEIIGTKSLLFTAKVENTDKSIKTLTSAKGWDSVKIECSANSIQVNFNSDEFVATSNISVSNGKSQWDYSIKNKTDNKSLISVNAPYLYLKKLDGNDKLFYPSKLGMISEKPTEKVKPFKIEGDEYDALTYPTGVDMSMQYMAYYGSDFGLYIGYHDPKASIKTYHVSGDKNNLKFYIETPVINATTVGNDFNMSGHVELDVFDGDWYDAAQIYKQWVLKNANYRPNMDTKRVKRQENLSKIGIWLYTSGENGGNDTKFAIDAFQDITHVGIVWNRWGEFGQGNWDQGYPNYFPARDGAKKSMDLLKQTYGDRVSFIPYINGRLFDTNLPNFQEFASKNAIKTNKVGEEDTYSIQNFGLDFAVMNPKSTDWQNIIAKAGERAINEMAVDGLYLDQIARSSVKICFDSDNCNGAIGGGSQWRDGYAQLLDKVNSKINNSFVMVEGNSDFVIDKVDSYLVQLAYAEKVVPAFQAVYSGKVNFNSAYHGTGDYNKPSFYAKFAHAFVNGIVPGQFSAYFGAQDDNSAPQARLFIYKLSKLRTLYRKYLALGFMQRAPSISITEGPDTVYSENWNKDDDVIQPVNIQSIQASAYCTKDNKSLGLFFANASINKTIKFNFTIPDNNCSGGIGKSVDVTLNGKEVVVYEVKNGEIVKL